MYHIQFKTKALPYVSPADTGWCEYCNWGCECSQEECFCCEVGDDSDRCECDIDCGCHCNCFEESIDSQEIAGFQVTEDYNDFGKYYDSNFVQGFLRIGEDGYGYIDCVFKEYPDIEAIKEYISGQLSDGIGEGLEQTEKEYNGYQFYITWSGNWDVEVV